MADDGEGGGGIVGFLFGNVNPEGELEDDGLLDADSRRQLGQLHDVLGSYLGDLQSEDGSREETPAAEEKAADAVDYGDIDEVCDEPTRSHHMRTAMSLLRQQEHNASPLTMQATSAHSPSMMSTGVKMDDDDDDDYDDLDTPASQASLPVSVGQASGPSPTSFISPPLQPVAMTTSRASPITVTTGIAMTTAGIDVIRVDGVHAAPPSSAATVRITPKTSFIPARLSALSGAAPPAAASSPGSLIRLQPVDAVPAANALAANASAQLTRFPMPSPVARGANASPQPVTMATGRPAGRADDETDQAAAGVADDAGVHASDEPVEVAMDTEEEPPVRKETREEILVLARRYYPDFHPDKVIRFSRLFGPGRSSSIPRTWRDIAMPRKRHRHRHRRSSSSSATTATAQSADDSQSDGDGDVAATTTPVVAATAPRQESREAADAAEPAPVQTQATSAVAEAVAAKSPAAKPPQSWVDDNGRLRFGRLPTIAEKDVGEEEHFLKSQVRGPAKRRFNPDVALLQNGLGSESDRVMRILEAAAWRHGPASLLYDMLDVPEDATSLDTVFGKKKKQDNRPVPAAQSVQNGSALLEDDGSVADAESDAVVPLSPSKVLKEDAFSMVSQVAWEDEIIWKDEDIVARGGLKISTVTANHAGLQAALQRRNSAPVSMSTPNWKSQTSFSGRKQSASSSGGSAGRFPAGGHGNGGPNGLTAETEKKEPWFSLFPVENQDLLNGDWTTSIIWDADAIPTPVKPFVLKLNCNDDNLLLGLPEDSAASEDMATPHTGKKETKKSKLYGSKKDKHAEEAQSTEPQVAKDPFNLSNDDYYSPQLNLQDTAGPTTSTTRLTVQHSTPALELHSACFPTHLSPYELRSFHRQALKIVQRGPLSGSGFKPITSVTKAMKKKAKEREKERAASGGGEVFFMRSLEDLSCADGDLVLVEACEEHPPLIQQRGMGARIVTYYKRKPVHDPGPPKFNFGEVAYIQQSPFLGNTIPGQALQSLECSLYRAPVYEHRGHPTDFVVIRTHDHYYIREYNGMFVMGQECPKVEVPGPNSKRAGEHIREFLKAFIFRLFRTSTDMPRRIKMETIRKAFPSHSESSVRKRLKVCADFKRTGAGNDCGWWVLKEDFQLPSEEKMRALMTPENCCAFYSMQAAEQRLKDAGFGGKSMVAEEEEEDNQKLDDEVLTAPWHTTRNFIAASKGKCQLAVFGNADPTGCGEGFSYARVPNKPMQGKEEGTNSSPVPQKKAVTGTDADLRRLQLKDAREVLKKDFGYTEEELNKLGRWAVIDALRTHSTQAAKEGKDGMKNSKFARGSRFSMAEHQERYREDCQRIFDVQNKVLASAEVLSTDEGSDSEDEGKNLDVLAEGLDDFLTSSKSTSQLTFEQEESERRKLQDLLDKDSSKDKDKDKDKDKADKVDKGKDGDSTSGSKHDGDDASLGSNEDQPWMHVGGKNRRLLIHRTFEEDGKMFVRTEIVTHPDVIDAYLRVAGKKDKSVYAEHDEHTREAMRREKRRIQEQLRRIKRNEEKERIRAERRRKKMEEKEQNPNLAKMRCGACGGFGHMKTNKHCPKYIAKDQPLTGSTEDVLSPVEESAFPQDHLVKVEGTKVSFDKSILEHTNRMRRDALRLTIPRDVIRKRRRTTSDHCDYLQRHAKTTHRRRTNPVVDMGNIFEKQVLEKMRQVPDSYPFHVAVPPKQAPDYNKIIKEQMHLQLMKDNVRDGMYRSREEFLVHVELMVTNSLTYNGKESPLTRTAERMQAAAFDEIGKNERLLSDLERLINPLLSDDPMITLAHHLEVAAQKMRVIPDSWPFHFPVQAKDVPDYYQIIKQPMDLQTLAKHCQEHYYRLREDFLRDVRLIHTNSLSYNGKESPYTQTALRLIKTAEDALAASGDQLELLEAEIANQTPLSSIGNSPAPPSASYEDPFSLTDGDMLHKHDVFNKPISLADYCAADDDAVGGVGLSHTTGTNYERVLNDLEASSGDDDDDDDDEDDMDADEL